MLKRLGEQNVVLTGRSSPAFDLVLLMAIYVVRVDADLKLRNADRPDDLGVITIDLQTIEECVQRKALRKTKDGDAHYDVTSLFKNRSVVQIQMPLCTIRHAS